RQSAPERHARHGVRAPRACQPEPSRTVRLDVPFTPEMVAVIVTAPTMLLKMVLANPVESMVTLESELPHDAAGAPATTVPPASFAVAGSAMVASRLFSVVFDPAMIDATTGCTVTRSVPEVPPPVATTVLAPKLTAVTSPVEGLTVITFVLASWIDQ